MRKIIIPFLALFLLCVAVSADDSETETTYPGHKTMEVRHGDCQLDNINIEFDNRDLIMTNQYRGGKVRITPEYDLYVNGKKIEMDDRQRKTVQEFYEMMFDFTDYAVDLGIEGAKIGVSGAALGISALGKVFRLLSDDYDTEDLEHEMEREAAKIERKAEKLEKRADEVEWMAEELQDLYGDMEREFVELRDLRWD